MYFNRILYVRRICNFHEKFFWTQNHLKYRQIFRFMIIWPKFLNIYRRILVSTKAIIITSKYIPPKWPKISHFWEFMQIQNRFCGEEMMFMLQYLFSKLEICSRHPKIFFIKKYEKLLKISIWVDPPPPKTAFLVEGGPSYLCL